MKNINIRNQHKVLKKITSMCYSSPRGILYEPKGFKDNFPYLTNGELSLILDILSDKELIEITYDNCPDSFNIWSIVVTTMGYNYLPQVSFDNTERWKERIWGFLSGSVFTSVMAFLIQKFV